MTFTLLLFGDDNEVARLAKEYALKSKHENTFVFVSEQTSDMMLVSGEDIGILVHYMYV